MLDTRIRSSSFHSRNLEVDEELQRVYAVVLSKQ
jgi:hypothetical protein